MLVVLLVISIVLSAGIISAGHGWSWFRSIGDSYMGPYLGYVGYLAGAILLMSVNLNIVVLLLLQVLVLSAPYEIALVVINVILLIYNWWIFFGPR